MKNDIAKMSDDLRNGRIKSALLDGGKRRGRRCHDDVNPL